MIFDEEQLNREQAEDEQLINLVDQIVTRNRAERYVKRLFNDAARIQHVDGQSNRVIKKLTDQYRNRIQVVR